MAIVDPGVNLGRKKKDRWNGSYSAFLYCSQDLNLNEILFNDSCDQS